jgi:hypothetical protein
MEIDKSLTGLKTGTYDSFFELSPKRIRKLSLGSFCYYNILKEENQFFEKSVLELFGGIGRSGLIIQNLFHPLHHEVYELDPGYASHIQETLSPLGVRASQGDAFKFEFKRNYDLVCLDHPSLTFKVCEDDPQVSTMIKAAAANSSNILLTFIGLSKVPVLREVYSKKYGVPIQTPEDYLRVGAAQLIPGFKPKTIFYTNSVFYVLFVEDWKEDPVLHKVTMKEAEGWFKVAE